LIKKNEAELFEYINNYIPSVPFSIYTIPIAEAKIKKRQAVFLSAYTMVEKIDEFNFNDYAWVRGDFSEEEKEYFSYTLKPCVSAEVKGTLTQGGWGTEAHGNNPGVYRDLYFSKALPNGLVIGDVNGYTITLTNSRAVQEFLPQGETPSALVQNYTNPLTTESGVLAGQITALALNIAFDYFDKGFLDSEINLADMNVLTGNCIGMSVQEVLNEANKTLGGTGTVLSAVQANECATRINENFAGQVDEGYLQH